MEGTACEGCTAHTEGSGSIRILGSSWHSCMGCMAAPFQVVEVERSEGGIPVGGAEAQPAAGSERELAGSAVAEPAGHAALAVAVPAAGSAGTEAAHSVELRGMETASIRPHQLRWFQHCDHLHPLEC